MAKYELNDVNDDLEDLGVRARVKHLPRKAYSPKQKNNKAKSQPAQPLMEMVQEERGELQMTYKAARTEAAWLFQSLHTFYQLHWFDDVLSMVKGGKEASVYLCKGHASTGVDYLAAKVYRPQMFRALKNDALYKEGREYLDPFGNELLNRGLQRAIKLKSTLGRELMHTSWIEHEVRTMRILHEAGADVPQYYANGDNAILMEYIGEEGQPAPTLVDVSLPRREAADLYERVLENLRIMLRHHRVHGDLSAYNILYWGGEITLIDFPQAIEPEKNRNAYPIFQRDVRRVTAYFKHQGVRTPDPARLAQRLWQEHGYPLAPDFDLRLLDDDDPEDRAYWDSLQNG